MYVNSTHGIIRFGNASFNGRYGIRVFAILSKEQSF